VLLYIERWLKAPVQMEDGSVVPRTAGTPQGGVLTRRRGCARLSNLTDPRRDSVGHSGWPSPRSRTRCPMRGNARVLSSPLSPSSNERTIPTGRSSLLTRRWREPDSNHRSLSSDKLRNWLEKAPELCAQGQPRCVRTREMSGGAAILTIEWLEGTIVMPECFTETLRAASEAGWSYAVQHR
jgi:hypothetical protein